MLRRTHLLIALCAVLPLFGQSWRKPIFVSAEQLDVAAMLPNPPSMDSPATAAELRDLHRFQDTRTQEQIARAKADDAEEDIFIFKGILGPKFVRESLPLTALLSDHVHNDEGIIVNRAKKFFQRPRPYLFDTSIKPVCRVNPNPTDYAYPSGHSTTGYVEALVLIMMVPDKRNAILARADEYAHNRLICGLHYATDTIASKSVAYAMISLIANHPQFQKELRAARAELRSALGLDKRTVTADARR